MASIRDLTVSLGFDFDKESLASIDRGIKTLKENLIGVGVAAAGAAATLFGFAKATADSANELRRAASEIGIGKNDLQVLGHLAETSGASFEDMTGGLRSLVGAMNAARFGAGTQADAFRRLGIIFKGSNGELLPVVDVYKQLADRMSRMQDGTKKTAIATDILGGSAGKLMETLSRGSSVIADAGNELASFGGIIDEAGFRKAQEFTLSLQRLMAQVKAIAKAVGFSLMPIIQNVIRMFGRWIQTNRELIKSNIAQFTSVLIGFLHRLFRITRSVVEVITGLYKGLNLLLTPFGGLVTVLRYAAYAMGLFIAGRTIGALFDVAKAVFNIGSAFNLVSLKALLIPILIAAAAAAIYLIVDDIVAFMDGRPSFLGYLLKNKDKILAQVKAFFERMKKFVLDFVEKALVAIFRFFDVPEAEAIKAAKRIRNAFDSVLSFITAAIMGAINIIMTLVRDAVALLVDLITKPKETFENLGLRFAQIFGNILRSGFEAFTGIAKALAGIFGVNGLSFDKVWANFKDTALSVIEYVQDKLGQLFQGLKGIVLGIGEFIFYIMSEFIKGAVALINAPIDTLKNLGKKLFDSIDGSPNPNALRQFLPSGVGPVQPLPDPLGLNPNSFLGIGAASNSNQSSVIFNPTINVSTQPGADGMDIAETIKKVTSEEFKRSLRQTNTVIQPAIKY